MTWAGVAKGIGIGVVVLVLTLDASVQEFADLIALSDEARRERFGLPSTCIPTISAVKGAAPNASRVTVLVACSTPPLGPPSPIKPTSWRHE